MPVAFIRNNCNFKFFEKIHDQDAIMEKKNFQLGTNGNCWHLIGKFKNSKTSYIIL